MEARIVDFYMVENTNKDKRLRLMKMKALALAEPLDGLATTKCANNQPADIVNRYLDLLDKPTRAAAMGVLSSVERFIEQADNNYPYMAEFAAMAVSLSDYINEETATPQIAAIDLNNIHKISGVNVDNSELKGIVSSKTLLAHQFEPLNFGGKWKLLFGRPTAPFKVMVHGAPGNGKSTFAIQFAKYLASSHKLRVLYIANEESFTYTFQEKLMRLNAIDDNLKIADSLPDNFDDYDVAFFDSVNTMKLDIDDLRRIFKQNDKTSFVLIFQNNKKGQFRGSLECFT
ncbi:MAG: DNA repair protein RadA [Salinivirgaceae bacterium]|nr:DNA repair protein RadA [Salinivirgaceae bacterium]